MSYVAPVRSDDAPDGQLRPEFIAACRGHRPGLPPRDRYRIAEGKHSYDLEYQLPTEAP